MRAAFFQPLPAEKVKCLLCPRQCVIAPGEHGFCLARYNNHGELIAETYAKPISTAVDPIEKKPLFHFKPGSSIFSTGPCGCTFKCSFCQNHSISQQSVPVEEVALSKLFDSVVSSTSAGIAFTYSEPLTWYETIMDLAPRIHEARLANILVTNGYIRKEPLETMLPFIDAMNIDIKSMREDFYRTRCKATLKPVLETCEIVKKQCHLEITNLVIPDLNDSDEEIQNLTTFIAHNLGKDTPLHFSRYFPQYNLSVPATPAETLVRAREIALQELDYVYIGNIAIDQTADTFCPTCQETLIVRSGHRVVITDVLDKNSACCKTCGSKITMIF